jgi:DNA-binding protein HU-beta
MNKAELVSAIAESAGITNKQANAALEASLEAIIGALKEDKKVTLVGFGTFSVSERAARKGRNPRTNEEIEIPAKKVARFKPGKDLSDL